MGKLKDKNGFICDIDTVLVLSGITKREDLILYSYQPDYILERAADIMSGD